MPDGEFLRTVFLDRDGTINVKAPEGSYVTSPEQFVLLPGAAQAIRQLNEAHVRVVVVTNQRGISRGLMSQADLSRIHARMSQELASEGAWVDAIYACPHGHGECDCRKPATGLIDQAIRDFPQIRRETAAVIGDAPGDVELGLRAGMRPIRLEASPIDPGDSVHSAPDLATAVTWFLAQIESGLPG